MSYFKRVDLNVMYPHFVDMCQKLQAACLARGVAYYATSGMRTVEEQEALYAQGRTKPGQIVTKARGGQSYHNFGIAMDFTFDKDQTRAGLQPDWSPESYVVLGEEAVKLGLEWGGVWKFKDLPHVQIPLNKVGLTLADLQKLYATGGYKAVFSRLDQFRW